MYFFPLINLRGRVEPEPITPMLQSVVIPSNIRETILKGSGMCNDDGTIVFSEEQSNALGKLLNDTWGLEDDGAEGYQNPESWAFDDDVSRAEEKVSTQPSVTFGNTTAGSGTNYTSIESLMAGSVFTVGGSNLNLYIGRAFVLTASAARYLKMAVYRHSDLALVAVSSETYIPLSASGQWVSFIFPDNPVLTASTDYIIIVYSQAGTGTIYLYWSDSATTDKGHTGTGSYPTVPDPLVPTHNNYNYSVYIYCTT